MAGKGTPRTGVFTHPRAVRTSAVRGSSMLSPELHEKLVHMRKTTHLMDAQIALKCGVTVSTLRRWLRKGVEEEWIEPYTSFTMDYLSASIDQENDALSAIRKGDNVKGNTWWLEKRFPTRWGWRASEKLSEDIIEICQLMEDSAKEGRTIEQLFANPPRELKAAIRQAGPQILAILQGEDDDDEDEDETPQLAVETTGESQSE